MKPDKNATEPDKNATEPRKNTEISVSFRASVAIILLITMHACSAETVTEDPFREFIIENYTLIPTEQVVHPGADEIYNAGGVVAPADSENLIILDQADQTIKMLNRNGEIVNTAGGRGRGPGELGEYARFFLGEDHKLYVIDGLNHRVHIYEIIDDTLNLLETKPFNYPAGYFFDSIYSTETGLYGLFSRSENTFFSPDNRYYLYTLDQNLEMKEKLLELPGEQRTRVDDENFTFYFPNIFTEKTLWSMDGDWFYYMSSHKTIIHRFNVSTGVEQSIDILGIPLRENHPELIEEIIARFVNEDDISNSEQVTSVLYENESLPMFSSFKVSRDRVYIQTYYSPGEKGMLLIANLDTNALHYVETPHGFGNLTTRGDTIYGVDYDSESGAYELLILRLKADFD